MSKKAVTLKEAITLRMKGGAVERMSGGNRICQNQSLKQ
jgi:hypothetical protein